MCSCACVCVCLGLRGEACTVWVAFFIPAIGNPWQCDSVIKVKNHSARNSPGQQQVHWGGGGGGACAHMWGHPSWGAGLWSAPRTALRSRESCLCHAVADHCGCLSSCSGLQWPGFLWPYKNSFSMTGLDEVRHEVELCLRISLTFHSGGINFYFKIKDLSDAWLQKGQQRHRRLVTSTSTASWVPMNKSSHRLRVVKRGRAFSYDFIYKPNHSLIRIATHFACDLLVCWRDIEDIGQKYVCKIIITIIIRSSIVVYS